MDTQNLIYILIGTVAVLAIALVWLFFKLNSLDKIRQEFFGHGVNTNLEQILVDQNRNLTQIRTDLDNVNNKVNDLTAVNESNFKKIGFVRFNPYGDDGGNVSFTLALLDGHDTGIVLSSFHSRNGTRVYSKQITKGVSESKLTQEEEQAVKEAR